MSKIIDAFMFGLEYELEILKWRFEYLSPRVDYFVLVEALYDQMGRPKPAFFLENRSMFENYLSRTIHVVLQHPVTQVPGSWENENHQRNSIIKGLTKIPYSKEDIIIISDLDEFPSLAAIDYYIANQEKGVYSLNQSMFYYFVNLRARYDWRGSQIFRGVLLEGGASIQKIRDARERLPVLPLHGGWHFSYLGGVNSVLKKINSVCESDVHKPYNNEGVIAEFIERRRLHFNGAELDKLEVPFIAEKELPGTLVNRKDELIAKGFMLP